jgi:hypothetical protein
MTDLKELGVGEVLGKRVKEGRGRQEMDSWKAWGQEKDN